MLSVPHLIIIFIVALAVLGPDKLPQVARALGKAMADFRRVTGDFRYQIESEMREMDRQTRLKELEQQEQNRIAAPPGTVPTNAPSGTTNPELDALVPPTSADPQNPYVQAEDSAYTASLNLSAPYAAPSPDENAARAPNQGNREENSAPDPLDPPVEVVPSERQKPGNGHS